MQSSHVFKCVCCQEDKQEGEQVAIDKDLGGAVCEDCEKGLDFAERRMNTLALKNNDGYTARIYSGCEAGPKNRLQS